MENNELLKDYLEAMIADPNSDNANELYSAYAKQKAQQIVAKMRGGTEQVNEVEKTIKLDGNDVLVAGKVVGHVETDPADKDSKIKFKPLEGNAQKFDSAADLFKSLAATLNT